jgi:flagellar assembly protein FliH
MSLSKVFRGQGDFQPEQLVPRPATEKRRWQAVTVTDQTPASPPHKTIQHPDSPEKQQGSDPPSKSSPPSIGQGNGAEHGGTSVVPSPEETQSPLTGEKTVTDKPPEPTVDLDELRETAFQEGFAQGRREGMAQADSDFGSALAALQQISEQLSAIRETILKNSKSELVELVFALAEKIIRHSVREQDQTILATVEEALNQAVRSSEFAVYLHPDDMAVIKERAPEFIASLNGLEQIAVKSDAAVEQGGCRIESETCTVDATVASQLGIIREQLDNRSSP